MIDVAQFEIDLLGSGIVDPEKVHSVFTNGDHGQKVDFDKIDASSNLFRDCVEVTAQAIDLSHPEEEVGRLLLVSVASGTNRFVGPIAEELGDRAGSALTTKLSDGTVELTPDAVEKIKSGNWDFTMFLEDTGTTGGTAASGVLCARMAGAERVAVKNILQRQPVLKRLIEISAPYSSVIAKDLPTYSPIECQDHGFCSMGWELKQRLENE